MSEITDLIGEIWKTVWGFSDYEVSNLGRIKRRAIPIIRKNGSISRPREHLLHPSNAEIALRHRDGTFIFCQLGRLVLQSFISDPPNPDSKARHLNDDRSNSSLVNLAWGSQAENIADAIRNGRFYGRPMKPEHKAKLSQFWSGRQHSKATREKMSVSGKARMQARKDLGIIQPRPKGLSVLGRIWITNGLEARLVFTSDLVPVGWWKGRK